jgi:hypothetical protein
MKYGTKCDLCLHEDTDLCWSCDNLYETQNAEALASKSEVQSSIYQEIKEKINRLPVQWIDGKLHVARKDVFEIIKEVEAEHSKIQASPVTTQEQVVPESKSKF